MSNSSPNTPSGGAPAAANCPACGGALPPQAVLCVDCGYHLKLQRHLATAVEKSARPAIDPNPFAPPAEPDVPQDAPRIREPYVADLTPDGARQAKAIVSDASSAYALVVLGLCCWPVWLLLFPWFGYRLWSWYGLNRQYGELRNPNGFSEHGELAVSFQDSKFRLWVGFVAGSIYWGLAVLNLLLQLATIVLEALLDPSVT